MDPFLDVDEYVLDRFSSGNCSRVCLSPHTDMLPRLLNPAECSGVKRVGELVLLLWHTTDVDTMLEHVLSGKECPVHISKYTVVTSCCKQLLYHVSHLPCVLHGPLWWDSLSDRSHCQLRARVLSDALSCRC